MSFIDTIREDIGTVKTHDPAAQSDFVISCEGVLLQKLSVFLGHMLSCRGVR